MFDYELLGNTGLQDAFDIDLASTRGDYKVTGFEVGADKLVLIGGAGTSQTTFDGTDSHVSVLESAGGQTTNITVVGVDLTQGSGFVVFG